MRGMPKRPRRFKTLLCGVALIPLLCWPSVSTAQQVQEDSSELQIASPSSGTVVNPGQSVSVVVTPAAGIALTKVGIIGTGPIASPAPVSSPPFQFSIVIPTSTAPGSYYLTAGAIDGSGQVVLSVSVSLRVEPSTPPVSIAATPPQLFLEAQGQLFPLSIAGTFADGSVADVTNSSKMVYTSTNR